MPPKVRLALGLMWFVWAAGAIHLLAAWLEASRSAMPSATMLGIIYAVILVALVFLIRAVSLGRNWARLTYSGLAVIAVGSIVRAWFRGGLTPTQLLIGAGLIIAYSTILVFLFHSSSGRWFSKPAGNAT
jgi:uncharacterized membrane protein